MINTVTTTATKNSNVTSTHFMSFRSTKKIGRRMKSKLFSLMVKLNEEENLLIFFQAEAFDSD